jgi:hypothetical protein
VEFAPTTAGDGRPDWIMLYRPGPKARAEYRAFARRGGPAVLAVEPLTADPPPRPAAPGPSPLEAEVLAQADPEARRACEETAPARFRATVLLGLVREHVARELSPEATSVGVKR